MKKLALAVAAIALQTVVAFAGEPVVPSQEVIAPTPPPPAYFSPNEFDTASRSGSVTGAAGIITSDIILRLSLDDFWSGVHLAPYGFVGERLWSAPRPPPKIATER
jgi:hypothetical protein